MFYFVRLYEVNRDSSYFRSNPAFWSYAHCYASFHDVKKRTTRAPETGWLDLPALRGLCVHATVYGTAIVVATRGEHWTATAAAAAAMATSSLSMFGHTLSLFHAPFGVDLPPLMREPWRADSLQAFWGKQWNTVIEAHLSEYVYRPLRKGGVSRALAVVGCFLCSGLVHAYPYVLAGGTMPGATSIILYFLVQAFLLGIESASMHKDRDAKGSVTVINDNVINTAGWIRTMLAVALPSPLVTLPFAAL